MTDKLIKLDRTLPTVTKETRRWFEALFSAVGQEFNMYAVTVPGWYVANSWSKDDEQQFLVWLANDMKGYKGMNQKQAEKAAMWFVSNYGWKVINAKEKAIAK